MFEATVLASADGAATGARVICCNASWAVYPICNRSLKVPRLCGVSFKSVFMVESVGSGCKLDVVVGFELVRPILFSLSQNYVVIRVYIYVYLSSLVLPIGACSTLFIVSRVTSLSNLIAHVCRVRFCQACQLVEQFLCLACFRAIKWCHEIQKLAVSL